MKLLWLMLAALFLSLPIWAGKHSLDTRGSTIGFSVKHLSVLPVKGKFTKFEGFVDYSTDKDKIDEVYIKIDVDTINTSNDDRDAHLKSKDFFHVRNDVYDIVPENRYIEFRAKNFSLKKASTLKGSLKILKTKKEVIFQVKKKTVKTKDSVSKISVVAEGKINRKHFGLSWQKPSSGLKEKIAGKFVGDEVKMTVNLAFVGK